MTEITEQDPNEEDQRLIVLAQGGDLAAFNLIVERHQRAVYSTCLRMLRDPHLAEDATQDSFIRAWNAIDSFRGGIVRPWLLRIATNRTYDMLRSKARKPAASLDAQPFESEPEWATVSVSEHPEQYSTRGEMSAFLEQALLQLPEDQRLAIVLSDVQGYGYDEIADIMNTAVGTVKSRISRGRSRLREYLQSTPAGMELAERFVRLPNE
ncbi:MAG: sigma-70 family RNA polymerase sigma factor [Thermomicrobiales bacterium]|nr:sigma-70 family RNA polymerase sigma factor [Thermomicrobiales bacterium]